MNGDGVSSDQGAHQSSTSATSLATMSSSVVSSTPTAMRMGAPLVGVGEIAGLMSSLKAAKDIAQTMVGVRDAAAFQEKRIELQSKILDAQNSAFAAQDERSTFIERIRELEEELARLKAFLWRPRRLAVFKRHEDHLVT
jgi:hypothetical protein